MLPAGNAQQQAFGCILMEMGGGGKNKGAKVGTKHIEQSATAGCGNGRQWGGGADGGQ